MPIDAITSNLWRSSGLRMDHKPSTQISIESFLAGDQSQRWQVHSPILQVCSTHISVIHSWTHILWWNEIWWEHCMEYTWACCHGLHYWLSWPGWQTQKYSLWWFNKMTSSRSESIEISFLYNQWVHWLRILLQWQWFEQCRHLYAVPSCNKLPWAHWSSSLWMEHRWKLK